MRIQFEVPEALYGDLYTAALFCQVTCFSLGAGSMVIVEADPEQPGAVFDVDMLQLYDEGTPKEALSAVSNLRSLVCQRFAMLHQRAA
jgi:hypothetical protein